MMQISHFSNFFFKWIRKIRKLLSHKICLSAPNYLPHGFSKRESFRKSQLNRIKDTSHKYINEKNGYLLYRLKSWINQEREIWFVYGATIKKSATTY